MSIELMYKISLSIPDLRAISECTLLPAHIRDKADKQITKAVHGLVKATHAPKAMSDIAIANERVKALASETEEEREARIQRELDEEEAKIMAKMGF